MHTKSANLILILVVYLTMMSIILQSFAQSEVLPIVKTKIEKL